MAVAALAVAARAQLPQVHPHVAPVAPSTTEQDAIPGSTPLLNYPNGSWDNGEAFGPSERGGILSRDRGDFITLADVQTTLPWTTFAGGDLQHYTGYLYPSGQTPPSEIEDAAFEVIAPGAGSWVPSQELFIVIATHSSMNWPEKADGGRFAYPGTRDDGHIKSQNGGIARPLSHKLVREARLAGYNVVLAHIVPRIGGRSLLFRMQRNLQLLEVVTQMLMSNPPPGMPGVDPHYCHVLIAGGSFGGYSAPLSALLFPDRFHGAHAGVFSGAVRRALFGEQEMWRFIAATSGFCDTESGRALSRVDMLQISAYLRQEETDLFSTSIARRWNDGEMPRPVYFVVSDEDSTTTGTDWLSLFHGFPTHIDNGTVHEVRTPTFQAGTFLWSIADKRCHVGSAIRFTLAGSTIETTEIRDSIVHFLPDVAASHLADPTSPITIPPRWIGPDLGPGPAPTTDDAYDHVFARGTIGVPGPTPSELLTLDASFGTDGKTPGSGLWLGHDESLVVHDGFIYCGSADGVVTKFDVDANREITPVASTDSLGHAAWGLAVGDVDGSQGDEVVVATHRDLHVLDAGDLTVLATKQLPWSHTRPRRIRIADLFPGTGGSEILYTSLAGQLVVLDKDLNVLTDYHEPGIADLLPQGVALPAESPPQSSVTPITLLSERGHLANVTLGTGAEPPAYLHQASMRQLDNPIDLELAMIDGEPRLVGLFANPDVGNLAHEIREFDPVTLALIGAPLVAKDILAGRDLAVLTDNAGTVYYVVVEPNKIVVMQRANPVPFRSYSLLFLFGPARNATAVTVGDVFDVEDATFDDEVVISTETGNVVWFSLDEATGTHLGIFREGFYTQSNPATPHTNRALVGAWGMLAEDGELEVIDQTWGRWGVQADGAVHFRHEFPGGGGVRDLSYVGSVPAEVPGTKWKVDQLLGGHSLTSFPYVPTKLGDPAQVPDWNPAPTKFPLLEFDGDVAPFRGGYLAHRLGGDYLGDPTGAGEAHWWAGEDTWPNVMLGAWLTPTAVTDAWRSADEDLARTVANDFRNTLNTIDALDTQSLRLVKDPNNGDETLIVAGTCGGSVLVVRPGDPAGSLPDQQGEILAESDDFGMGGIALAATTTVTSSVSVFLGTLAHHADPAPYRSPALNRLAGSIHMLEYAGGTLTLKSSLRLEDVAGSVGGLGVCGLAVGELDASKPGPELVATTLSGDLFVFDVSASGVDPAPLFQTRVPGSLGVYNSIVIADLEEPGPENELYVAGSQGVWKWVVNN